MCGFSITLDEAKIVDEEIAKDKAEIKRLTAMLEWIENDMKARIGHGPLWSLMHRVHGGEVGLFDGIQENISEADYDQK